MWQFLSRRISSRASPLHRLQYQQQHPLTRRNFPIKTSMVAGTVVMAGLCWSNSGGNDPGDGDDTGECWLVWLVRRINDKVGLPTVGVPTIPMPGR
jgi:hypothetical protein